MSTHDTYTYTDPATVNPDGTLLTSPGQAPMRFAVDAWDPSYGSSVDVDPLAESTASVNTDVEIPTAQWRPLNPDPSSQVPPAVVFVDGVRRIEARLWIDDVGGDGPATEASAALCGSYAAGAVCCCGTRAHRLTASSRRGLFTTAPHATSVTTSAGTYEAKHTTVSAAQSQSMALSTAFQSRLLELELIVAVDARAVLTEHLGPEASGGDLLIIDGPLRGREQLPRALGFIKSHLATYLPDELNRLVGQLRAGQRTPVFLMGTTWDRHSWYLKLPTNARSPWAGIVRVEASADLDIAVVTALASQSQVVLPRFASVEYKDPRAPQNLYPIAGLERDLRHRLGDQQVLYRALRYASSRADV